MRTASLALVAVLATASPRQPSEDELLQMYDRFRRDFGRMDLPASDVARRFAAFKVNVGRAFRLNLEQGIDCQDLFDDKNCVFGIGKFADLFQEEMAATRKGFRRQANARSEVPVLELDDNVTIPTHVDWRTKGAVSPVKDQGQCGNCWAYSAVEEIESAVFMKTGKMPVLSTQQVTSCDKVDGGCDGGDTITAFKYVEKAGGLDTNKDYPDTSSASGATGKCKWDKKEVAKISGFTYVTPPCQQGPCKHQKEKKLAAALAKHGPVSICVNAGDWDAYQRGIYKKKCSGAAEDLDHCVQLVGYDMKEKYWIVRNSWAADWGEKGFMRIAMGENLCGIADEATLVQAAGAAEVVV